MIGAGKAQIRAVLAVGAVLLTMVLTLALAAPGVAEAAKGDQRAGMFLGTTTMTTKGYRTFGTRFGGTFGWEFQNDLLLIVGGSFVSADGDVIVTDSVGNNNQFHISGNSLEANAGLLYYLYRNADSPFAVFAGGGLSLLNYDFDYTGTELGKTSGAAPGAFGNVGLEVHFNRNFTMILDFGFQAYQIKTQTGDSTGLASGGLMFSLRLSN